MKSDSDMRPLRVGIIVDNADLHFIAWDLIERSAKIDAYDVSALIVQQAPPGVGTSPWAAVRRYLTTGRASKLFGRLTFELITRLEAVIVQRMKPISCTQDTKPLDDFDIQKLAVQPRKSKSGLVFRYSPDDLDAIKTLELDVLVRAGAGILRGEILSVCRYGVLSFHHGDNRVNRGSPAGFWEVYFGAPKTGFIIQRLTEELDGGDVLFRGATRTKPLYLMNQSSVFYKSAPFFSTFLKKVAETGRLPEVLESWPYGHPLFSTPTLIVQIGYVARVAGRVFRRFFRRLRRVGQRWAVAYMRVPDWRNAALWRAKPIENPEYRYLADPFVWSEDGQDFIFVEDFDVRNGKGSISAIDITYDSPKHLGLVLDEPFHLSFPFMLKVNGKTHMIPESHQIQEIRLYQCDIFPQKWSLSEVLISDISAVDTMVFFKDGLWWLLTNIDSAQMNDYESELHIYFSENISASSWSPHPGNPVVFDPERARNGGLLVQPNGDLYRVFQRQSIDYYGAAMGVARITDLSPTTYSEEVVSIIDPEFFAGAISGHSLNHEGGILAFDYAKIEKMSP
ncbi:hypothetical protein N9R74_02125 [bacterium]|nr:hypothetical protein [bacterium]